MPDDDSTLVAAARPQPPRRRGALLAMVGLLAVAGLGLATRLDRPGSRTEVGAGPSADDVDGGGVGTSAPPTTGGAQSVTAGTPPPPQPHGTTVDATTNDPIGTARVSLGCGDTAETRQVTAFEAEPAAGGPSALYWAEPAGRLHPLRVGDQFPAGARLAWAVTGVQLGPWDLDTISDSCSLAIPTPTVPPHYTVPPTSVTAPVPGYDQAWTASATLACGDTADSRRVTSFRAVTNGAGPANVMAWDPASGLIQQLAVGDEFPVTHVLSWSIQGVLLGPWPVPQVTDGC
ncbi:MAG: hypothetical protein R2761_04925 [Acidimicrobiales bacterium]